MFREYLRHLEIMHVTAVTLSNVPTGVPSCHIWSRNGRRLCKQTPAALSARSWRHTRLRRASFRSLDHSPVVDRDESCDPGRRRHLIVAPALRCATQPGVVRAASNRSQSTVASTGAASHWLLDSSPVNPSQRHHPRSLFSLCAHSNSIPWQCPTPALPPTVKNDMIRPRNPQCCATALTHNNSIELYRDCSILRTHHSRGLRLSFLSITDTVPPPPVLAFPLCTYCSRAVHHPFLEFHLSLRQSLRSDMYCPRITIPRASGSTIPLSHHPSVTSSQRPETPASQCPRPRSRRLGTAHHGSPIMRRK